MAVGDRKQFFFEAWIRTLDIQPAPDGYAYVGVEQLDSTGEAAYAAKVTFEELRTSSDWHKVERLFYLIPTCVRLRVRIGLMNATGSVWGTGFRLEVALLKYASIPRSGFHRMTYRYCQHRLEYSTLISD